MWLANGKSDRRTCIKSKPPAARPKHAEAAVARILNVFSCCIGRSPWAKNGQEGTAASEYSDDGGSSLNEVWSRVQTFCLARSTSDSLPDERILRGVLGQS